MRTGGVSATPFDSFNLGDHVGDNAVHVAGNRAKLHQSIQARPVFLKQVHGVEVIALNHNTSDGAVADACITTQRGVACTIMVADCLPLLFTDRAGSFVAAAHAGWRGLLGQGGVGVIESIYQAFMPIVPVAGTLVANKIVANDVLVWLGPCIGPTQFEVGAEVQAAFDAAQPGATRHFQKIAPSASAAPGQPDKYLANLQALARDRLQALGITHIYGNDGSAPWCTVSNPSQFFSHRRDAVRLGSTGRMAACIWLA
ncbi:MAG: peptidoglycan editing factor PgeF [Burkholderiaceae bacterium]